MFSPVNSHASEMSLFPTTWWWVVDMMVGMLTMTIVRKSEVPQLNFLRTNHQPTRALNTAQLQWWTNQTWCHCWDMLRWFSKPNQPKITSTNNTMFRIRPPLAEKQHVQKDKQSINLAMLPSLIMARLLNPPYLLRWKLMKHLSNRHVHPHLAA